MNQFDLFGNPVSSKVVVATQTGAVSIKNGEYIFIPGFFNQQESDFYLKILKEKVLWKQESMNMYGKKVEFPRLVAWYGDDETPYSFSGISLHPNPWMKELLEIKYRIEPIANSSFNRLLLNFYRSGRDSVSWHSDAEPELGKNPIIASVSFGATRKFQLRHVQTREKIEIHLTHGSLLIMQGELQHYWQHQVPKTDKKVGERINLTFRAMNSLPGG
ncbi:MAG TPA: alpha-ketoglutarate-dependent dioxygenase AlkB [Prolixibacteraceae bacterium]|jgi:alkylated DNA repair dioxygenase AlkB